MAAAAASAAAAVRAIAMPAETTYSAGLLGAGADGEFSDAKTIEFTGDGKGFDEARIRRVFGGLRGSKTFIDCKVVVGPQKTAFRCHRFVLAARSKAMRAMLFGGWSESAKKIITLPDDSPKAWKHLIDYAYTGEWSKDSSMILELKDYADRYGFEDFAVELGNMLETILESKPGEIMSIAAQASAMGNTKIREIAFRQAFNDVPRALRSDGLMMLDRESIKVFLEDDRCADAEVDVFRAVVRWGLNQLALRAEDTPAGAPPAERPRAELKHAYSYVYGGISDTVNPFDRAAVAAAEAEEAESSASAAASGSAWGRRSQTTRKRPAPAKAKSQSYLSFSKSEALSMPAWEVRQRNHALDTLQNSVMQTADPAVLLGVLGDLLEAVRFPFIDGVGLATDVAPSGLLSAEQLAALFAHQLKPLGSAMGTPDVAGFPVRPRRAVAKELTITLWGAGGASGKHSAGGRGGAGGYLRVRYRLMPGETLKIYVGEGGVADKGSSEMTTKPWPNGGRGAFDYKSGSGGAATYVTSDRFGDRVVVGAGGGGGGSAAHSWASGGGGGGGTAHGKVGSGGDGEKRDNPREGKDGNGDGGKSESNGDGTDGPSSHGAGGASGPSTRSCGGAGGAMSVLAEAPVEILEVINASTDEAIKCPITGLQAGGGGKAGDCRKGLPGVVIIQTNAEEKRFRLSGSTTGMDREPFTYVF